MQIQKMSRKFISWKNGNMRTNMNDVLNDLISKFLQNFASENELSIHITIKCEHEC